MGYRNWKVTAKIDFTRIVLFMLLVLVPFASDGFGQVLQHFFYQIRKTDGAVAPGVNVRTFQAGTNTSFVVFSNLAGTTVKPQPMLTDSLGMVDFYTIGAVIDILFTGGTIPTQKLLNVTPTSVVSTVGIQTVALGGTGVSSFILNTVLLGNGTLPIKTSSVGLANQVFRVPAAGGQPDFGTVNLSSSAAVSGVLPIALGGTGSSAGSSLSVQEIDGSPNVSGVTNVKVTNNTLTDNGGGSVTVDVGPPFTDTISLIKGSGDPSKLLKFEVDGFTTATTRTITPPDASIVLAATNFLNLWADGVKQTFNPNATNAGFNVGAHIADPSAPVNGDQFYDSNTNRFRCYENGVWINCTSAGTGSPGGADTNVQFNDVGAFGGEADFIWNKTNNFLGIGATAALTDEGLSVANTGTHNGVISSRRSDASAPPGNSAGFRAYKSRGTIFLPTAVQSGDWLLGLSSNAHDGASFFGGSRIYSEATQNWTGAARGNRWVFSTTPDGSTVIIDTVRIPQDGGVQLLTGTKPTCNSTKRGYLYHVAGGAGVADTYEVCDKDVADVYAWRDIHGGSNPNLSNFNIGNKGFHTTYIKGSSTSFTLHSLCEAGMTQLSDGAVANVLDSTGNYINRPSIATTDTRGSFHCVSDEYQTQWEGEFVFKVKFTNITNIRIFVGLSATDITTSATSTPQAHCAIFRYATDVDGTAFWRTYTNDNDASPTTTTTTAAIVANTPYLLRIRSSSDGTSITFYVNDVLVATHSTNLPSTTTFVAPTASQKTLANEVKTILLGLINAWWE